MLIANPIVERSIHVIGDSDIRVKMNLEDEIERTYGKEMNELLGVIADKDNEIANKDNEIANKDNEIANKDNEIANKDNEIEKLLKELESMRNAKS